MSKKWLTLVALALVVTMVAVLAGCGGGSAPAKSATIKVGANFEMTGGQATFGQSSVNAVKLLFKQINAAGGVNGKKLELVVADNKSEPAEAANAMTKLLTQDKVVAVVGPVTSSDVLAASPIAMDKKVPVVSNSATNPKVTVENGKVKDFVFRACFLDPFQGTVAANFAAKSLKAKTAAVYVDMSSDYAKGLAQFFEEAFTKAGGKIVAKEAYQQKDTDFRAALTKIKAANPEVIFNPGYYQEVGMFVKQARELGITVPLMGGDGWDSPKLAEIAGAKALENTFFVNHYAADSKDPDTIKFVEAYKKEYGQTPDALAALAWDAALMVVEGIKKAGPDDSVKIKDAIAQTKNLKGVTGTINLNANHDPVKSAVIIALKDGKMVFKETVNP
ncbi:ABC transporter substrate-binding protein [Anaeroselena agilis]|uniref:ABC transporter substrate-binding protein n=1 Tax=Anaeroselena agilis TaxID=3063788 RepID=A0ABU3P2R7_9FIRM|nr:ABC transporter substrate-binding protein [Selenomonadales bacterium 4137-cl]